MGNKGNKLARSPQAVWPILKCFTKRRGPKTPSAIYGPLGLIFCPVGKPNIIADCIEKEFMLHNLCMTINDRWKLKSKLCWVSLLKTPM
jgi:hypothetical protein